MPWRGPGPARPDLPVPPASMPLLSRATLRKRWRYVGYYGEQVMFCAAWAEIGPFRTTFWSLWDREDGRVLGQTRMLPGPPEVTIDGDRLEVDTGSSKPDPVRVSMLLGESEPVEVVCPSGRGWGWTRKRAGVPLSGTIEAGERRWQIDGVGVDDQSAGYQARHTRWNWSAGVGRTSDGREIAWNLTAGINDPITSSECAVWIDGRPVEPGPVVFTGLDKVTFLGGERLDFHFSEGAERRRHDNFGLIRSDYVHRFGTFSGSLEDPRASAAGSGGLELAEASGVMEEHIAVW